MQHRTQTYRKQIFVLIFAFMLMLAGVGMLSNGALANSALDDLVNKVYLPIVSKPIILGGTAPSQ